MTLSHRLRAIAGFLALALLAGAGPLEAQVPGRAGGEVLGVVVDAETGRPVVGAAVAVWNPATSSIVTGAAAAEDGRFRVQGIPPGTYFVQVTSIGHAAHRSADFAMGSDFPRRDLGTIRLATALVEAEEVEVAIERPTVTIEPDRNTYVAQDVAPSAATASEVLEAVPSVQVDPDGRVSLRGNENVAVQINGRPAPVQGDQLSSYLQQLPANAIDRVEVIPTPSARHDPEGMAGIINLVMKRNTDLGTSGGVTLGVATAERTNVGANLGHQRGPVTLFTTYGYNRNERASAGINDRQDLEDGVPVSFTDQVETGTRSRDGHNLSTTLDTRLGERDVLTNGLTLNLRGSSESTVSAVTELDASHEVTDRYDRLLDEEGDSFVLDYTLGFRRTYEPRAHELSAELRFNRDTDDDRTVFWRTPPGVEEPRNEGERHETDDLEREVTGQVDYVRMLRESTKLEAGYKGSSRWIEREFTALEDSLGEGTWLPSDLSNAFDFNERVHAVYGVLSRTVGAFELQAGLRAERASQDFTLADESFPNDYTSFFPSGIAVYDPSDATQLKLSYSRRVRRPRTRELNPFPVFLDAQNVFIGNPELKPEYTDAFELGYTRSWDRGSLQVTPFYRRTSDIIRHIVDPEDVVNGREVTSVTFENLETSDSWGADVNASLDLGGWFDGLASFNVFKMVTDGGSATSLSSNAVTWSARLNGTTWLTPDLSLQAMYHYRAPMEFERGKFSSWQMSTVTLKQELWDERASLSLRLFDPFKTMGFRVEAGDEEAFQITEHNFDARALHLTFQINFGQAPKGRPPRTEPEQEPAGVGFPQ